MSEPSCLRCAALEREVQRLRILGRQDLDDLEDARGDIRALRRAVQRLAARLNELEGDRTNGDLPGSQTAPDPTGQ